MTTPHPRSDEGFTLIELIIYSAMLALVLGVVASLMISGVTNQARLTQTSQSATEGQLAMSSIASGVRNATAVNVPTAASPLLVIDTVDRSAAGAKMCQAWFYSATEKTLRTKTTLATGTKITAPTTSELSNWTLLSSNVVPVTADAAVFQTSALSATVSFSITTTKGFKQTVQSTVTSRQPAQPSGSTSSCF